MQFCYTSCNHEKCWTILLKTTGDVVDPNSVITFMRPLLKPLGLHIDAVFVFTDQSASSWVSGLYYNINFEQNCPLIYNKICFKKSLAESSSFPNMLVTYC